ncbi:MAG: HEAT repeat domain-containing protein [Gemmatimonadales bacterium]
MPGLAVPVERVQELIQVLIKGLRAAQLYMPNNPVYQRAMENIKAAFQRIWEGVDELPLDVGEAELRWESAVVYTQDARTQSEGLAWTFFKDGIRNFTLRRGVEDEEIVQFLHAINQARALPADAPEDLLTLLWAADFQYIGYSFRELVDDDSVPIEFEGGPPIVAPAVVQGTVMEEAGARQEGVVSTEAFETTLYFLDDREVEYLNRELEREYAQDLRRNVLSMLFDLLELQAYATVRSELISILENFIPYLLGAGDFRSVAFILRETREVRGRAKELLPEHQQTLASLPSRLSQDESMSQLLQSLDEAAVHPTEEELGDLFRELEPAALSPLMAWMPRLGNARVRDLMMAAAERLAQAHGGEVMRALASTDQGTRIETVRLAGRLKLATSPEGMGRLLDTGDKALKLAVVESLAAIGNAGAMRLLERAVEDRERDVRIAAVRMIAQRGFRNAFSRIEAAVKGGKLKGVDLTEKMAFFEAYGMMAATEGLALLERILVSRGGLLGRKADPEMRACAAMALGKMRQPEARAALERAKDDKEPLVRNAVLRALRGLGT